jgi:hypothetical protein
MNQLNFLSVLQLRLNLGTFCWKRNTYEDTRLVHKKYSYESKTAKSTSLINMFKLIHIFTMKTLKRDRRLLIQESSTNS